MTKFLHIVMMSLDGEQYTPELADDQVTDVAVAARDVAVGEWPGAFIAAAEIDYAAGTMRDVTKEFWGVIDAINRMAA